MQHLLVMIVGGLVLFFAPLIPRRGSQPIADDEKEMKLVFLAVASFTLSAAIGFFVLPGAVSIVFDAVHKEHVALTAISTVSNSRGLECTVETNTAVRIDRDHPCQITDSPLPYGDIEWMLADAAIGVLVTTIGPFLIYRRILSQIRPPAPTASAPHTQDAAAAGAGTEPDVLPSVGGTTS